MRRPRVLMVTGVYDPETSGASLQCRQLIASLRDAVDFRVLTTSADPALPRRSVVEGVEVTRVYVDPSQPRTKIAALPAVCAAFARIASAIDIVHLHGFSQKTVVIASLARLWRKRTIIKLTSVGHDDAVTIRRRGGAAFYTYRRVDRAIAVSPRLEQTWREAGLPADRVTFIPNAVDTARFRPAGADERTKEKASLGWRVDQPAVLFVGFVSHEKRPDVLYRAWSALRDAGVRSTLVLVGATRSRYYEIDSALADGIRRDAVGTGRDADIVWVEHVRDIERYFRASDVFVLPTLREGLPNVLLEAMACAVPPVITRLDGVTDWIVDDGRTGRLVPATDERALVSALGELLRDSAAREAMGRAAREAVEQRFAPSETASRTLALYRNVLGAVAA